MTRDEPQLPAQLAPPRLVLSERAPHLVREADVEGDVDVVALPVLPAGSTGGSVLLGPGGEELSQLLGVDLLGVLEAEGATGAVGEVTAYAVPAGIPGNDSLRSVVMVGVGAQRRTDLRRAGATLARHTRGRSAVATSIGSIADDDGLEAFAVGLVLGSFVFHWRSSAPERPPAPRVVLAGVPGSREPVLQRAVALAGAAWRARTLATVPSNLKNPDWLARQAQEVAAATGLDCTVWDETRLAAEGFGGVLAVGRASATPPRLIRLDYTPKKADRRTPTVVLVGKGITFDTGGLSIKPGEAMSTMKRDMTGGAVVIATLAALAEVGCPVRVVGLVPAAENAVSGSAMRPGDVIRHRGGRTTEVTNTDAEGRLVLADALAYAVEELDPTVVVDVATLTGAMKVALGQQLGGYFANDEVLAERLFAAGEESGEPLWRLPLAPAYEEKLASKIADADNAAGGPGAITAALFLQHFVGDVPWAHLDVASVGDSPGESYEWSAGPTGFGARVLLQWLGQDRPLDGIG